MRSGLGTTPFGRRQMTLGMVASQIQAKAVTEDATVHKWQVFHDISAAKDRLGATDRSLAILSALLSFHPETCLTGDGDLIVFPSNDLLIGRANGMSPATLRRHLAVLVSCGLIIRRDSPNGKRFARKGQGGEIEQAYGFDLSPLVARAEEFKALADAVRADKKALRLARERLTLCRRDILKLIDTGREEEIAADWDGFQSRYSELMRALPRTASLSLLQELIQGLEDLWSDIQNTLENYINSQNMNANESQTERHIHNSNTDSLNEIEQDHSIKKEASGTVEETNNIKVFPKKELPLGLILDACPNMHFLIKGGGGIRLWKDLLNAAEIARPLLGISPSAWAEARAILGDEEAATTLAAIYEKSDQINNPGGYLRSLVERAKEGKFSTWPMIMALLRAKLKEGKQAS